MPFVSNESIKQKAEKIKFAERVESKKEVQKINEVVNRVDPKAPLKDQDLLDLAKESRKYQDRADKANEPPKVTLNDIKQMEGLKQMMIEKKEEEIEKLLDNREMREIKTEIVGVLAIPHTNPDKRKIFQHLLNESSTVNQYVDENVIFRCFNRANSHLKFGAVYGLKYFKTNSIYDDLVKQRANANIIIPEIPKVEIPKTENVDIPKTENVENVETE